MKIKKIDTKVVVKHDSGGLFLNNFDKYFNDFKESIVAVPIRDVVGYLLQNLIFNCKKIFWIKKIW